MVDNPTVPDETIYALSSASGRSGVCVIRISGSFSERVLLDMCQGPFAPRVATVTKVVHPNSGELLDRGLAQAARVLSLQREDARLSGQAGELTAQKAQAEGRITHHRRAQETRGKHDGSPAAQAAQVGTV